MAFPKDGQIRIRPKLTFHCQLAHGSPTGIISGFTNVKQLYKAIADCYDIEDKKILYITLNSHKPEMNHLMGGQIGLEDFLFAHLKGNTKIVTLKKVNTSLGVTITDNGAGYAFIKHIRDGGTAASIAEISEGDHIECVNRKSMIGQRHFEVAKFLKEIPVGVAFELTLVEPLRSGFSEIATRTPFSGVYKKSTGKHGKETLRLRHKGPAIVQPTDNDTVEVAIAKLNSLLEIYMGISDTELAHSIWEVGSEVHSPKEFSERLDMSELQEFGFTEEYKQDMWQAIEEAKAASVDHVN